MGIKKVFLCIYDKAFLLKERIYDLMTRKEIIVSIGELMSYRGFEDGTQFLVASRLLDVESYINNKDTSFRFQKMMTLCGKADVSFFNDESARTIFSGLIKSYLEKGYNGKSHFLLDKDCLLRNGTHRTALHIYLKDYTAKAYVLKRKFSVFDDCYSNFKNNLQKDVFLTVENRLENIRKELIENGVSFCAVLPNIISLTELFDDIYERRSMLLKKDFANSFHFICNSFDLIDNQIYKLVLFTLKDPDYKVVNGYLESAKIKNQRWPSGVYVSRSCYEGKKIYDALKPYFINDNGVSE